MKPITNFCFTFYLDRTTSESQDKHPDTNQEFVSEDYESSTVNMDDIRREIEELTETKKTTAKNQENTSASLGKKTSFRKKKSKQNWMKNLLIPSFVFLFQTKLF